MKVIIVLMSALVGSNWLLIKFLFALVDAVIPIYSQVINSYSNHLLMMCLCLLIVFMLA